ncbi:MAG: magnesium transporter [Treponema sp.]|jgi:magnesium transporter|nr:magnesium transporter [Treponema sp.]
MEEILELINAAPFDMCKFHELVQHVNEVDIAEILSELNKEKLVQVFRLLPKDMAGEVFANIGPDEQHIIVEALTDSEVGEVVNLLFVDDAVDFIEEMPANVVNRVLKNVSPQKRKHINQILRYPDDSAGSIMTTEYIDLKETMTVRDALDYIRKNGTNKETIYTSYVVKPGRILAGIVSAKALMLAEPDERIEKIIDIDILSVNTNTDQESVAAIFQKYDLLSIPVVDNDSRLVGIITVDDILEIIEDENTEDFQKMAAMQPSDDPYLKTGIITLAKNRIVWLLVLMLSAAFTGGIIASFENGLAVLPILVAFIPMLMDTGGNAGSQSATLIIRGMAVGEIEIKDIFIVLWKEIRIGFICGIILGAVNFARVYFMYGKNLMLTLTVSASLFTTIIMAKMAGCMLPILAKKIKVDPAIMASPLITTIVDAASLTIYFSIARLLFKL